MKKKNTRCNILSPGIFLHKIIIFVPLKVHTKAMKVISSREFRDSQRSYLELSKKERVIIKRNKEYIELVPRGESIPENPSPSQDSYYDDPENLAELKRRLMDQKADSSSMIEISEDDQQAILRL